MNSKRWGLIAGATALTGFSGGVRADAPVTPTAGQQAAWALHLMEQARYGEAADAAQDLVTMEPNAAPSYEMRGTLALYVGNVGRAQADFGIAASHAPQEPAVLYGLGLCALFGRHLDQAAADFTQARQAPGLVAAQAADVDTARAYVLYLEGKLTDAQALASSAQDDSVRQELLAMTATHDQPTAGEALLAKFLQTPSGVPRVREDEGLRTLFDPETPVEPSVTEPSLQQMYATRLSSHMTDGNRQQSKAATISGTITLRAQVTAASVAVVSFSIDGQSAALLNRPPFTYSWDTTQAVNGRHVVTIEADDANGHTLTTQTRALRVENSRPGADDGHGGFTDADYTQAQARLWDLLRLRPARKAAEWALAERLASHGDTAGADAHRLVAAALDPDYKNGRHTARRLLGRAARLTAFTPRAVRVATTNMAGLWRGSTALKQVALTFDDGPNLEKTPALLDVLDRSGAPATFFVVGSRAEAAPDLLRRMARRGDDVENHSYTHINMDQAEPVVVEEELLRTCVVIQSLTGKSPRFFRPPGGNGDSAVMALANSYGMTGAFWTLDALPAEDLASPQGLLRYVLKRIQPGSIVLMHNAPDVTIAAMPALVVGLRARGYQLVTLTHMARSGAKTAPGAISGHE